MSAAAFLSLEALRLSANRRHVTKIMAIDKSYSMTGTKRVGFVSKSRLKVACEGACSIIDELQSDDHVAVLAFGEEIEDVSGGITDLSGRNKQILKRKIMSIKANGNTKLYDTILASANMVLEITATARIAGALIEQDLGTFWLTVLTDGEDNRSSSSLSDVKEVLQALKEVPSLGINIALIGVNLNRSARTKMQEMSRAGGDTTRFVDAQNLSQVTEAFTEIRLRMSRERIQVPVVIGSGDSSTRRITDGGCSSRDQSTPYHLHVRCIGHGRGRVSGVSIGDVGVVKGRDSDGDYIVDFPRQDNWYGGESDINNDLVADRVRPGALVAFKKTVTDPLYQWGSYVKYNHGLVVAVAHDGKVQLQLGQHPNAGARENLYNAQLQELEVIDSGAFSGQFRGHWPGQLQLGMAVRVPANVSKPSTEWGSLKRGEVGYVRAFKEESGTYVCDFPSCDGWIGRARDLEVDPVATLIRPGKMVRVRSSVGEPKYGWGEISRSSVGQVVSSRYDGGSVEVLFTEQLGWKGLLSELETVDAGHVHENIICDVCKSTIRGPRYKCMVCPNYDMCQPCYDGGHHDMPHTFWRLESPDSIPVELKVRGYQETPISTTPPQTKGTVVTPPSSPPIVVHAEPIIFNPGNRVRITGLVGRTEFNGQVGEVVSIRGNDKYCVKLSSGGHQIFQGVNLEAMIDGKFSIDSLVEIKGLSSARQHNGKLAAVVGHDQAKGRIRVKLLDEGGHNQLSLDPSNLVLIEEAC